MRVVVVGTGYGGVGADVQEIARGIGLDNRIGSKFLHAGPWFRRLVLPKGHPCADQDGAGFRCPLKDSGSNVTRHRAMARKVAAPFGGNLRGKTVAVLGLTFKPNTDDMREAPSIPLITALRDKGETLGV